MTKGLIGILISVGLVYAHAVGAATSQSTSYEQKTASTSSQSLHSTHTAGKKADDKAVSADADKKHKSKKHRKHHNKHHNKHHRHHRHHGHHHRYHGHPKHHHRHHGHHRHHQYHHHHHHYHKHVTRDGFSSRDEDYGQQGYEARSRMNRKHSGTLPAHAPKKSMQQRSDYMYQSEQPENY